MLVGIFGGIWIIDKLGLIIRYVFERTIPLIPSPDRPRLKMSSYPWRGNSGRYGKFIIREELDAYASEFLNHDPWTESANIDIKKLRAEGMSGGIRDGDGTCVYSLEIFLKNGPKSKFILKPVAGDDLKSKREQWQFLIDNPDTIGISEDDFEDCESEGERKDLEEQAFRNISCVVARQSLINQLYIGLQIERDCLEGPGLVIKTESPVGAYINNRGQKFAVYLFYKPLTLEEDVLRDQSREGYYEVQEQIDNAIEELGFYFPDTQFLVLDRSKPITVDNIVLIDLEQVVKFR